MSGGFLSGTKKRSVEDRPRRMAFWGAIAAIGFNTLLHLVIIYSEGVTLGRIFDYCFYSLVLSAIAWSSHSNRYFDSITKLGAALIFFHMWGRTFYMAVMGQGTVFSLPILMFTPLWLILNNTFRALMFYSVSQSIFVYFYTKNFLLEIYGIAPETLMLETYSITLAILSATMVTVLAIITYARQKTDDRLLMLIQEKEQLAAEDALTGLLNRRAFMEKIETLWRERKEFVVIFLDLDRFKPLNDEHGHAVDDLVLTTISRRMKREPSLNAVARLGGDEFAAIIEGAWINDHFQSNTEAVYDRITAPIKTETVSVTVGASIGYANALNDAANVSDLLHAADKAMMRSKANGGGVVKFDPELDDVGLLMPLFTETFRSALRNNQIIPALQPIVDARSGKILGHELLARWVDSDLTRDPTPAEFIPIAEKLGVLNEVLRVTLDGAMRYLRFQPGFLAINVSPSQLGASSFLDLLKSIARENEFPMERIEIEITEHIAFRNLETNIQTLEAARRLGCTISLDDFGSGYASLSLLDQLPLDKVKLDRSIQTARYRRDVLRATIRFAKELGFSCCVEGIETESDAISARLLGCDQMQGYWIGAPECVYPNVHFLKNAS
ncbi:MAG: EAL domain-containing protein [Pseudomonadota bacterium]